VIPAPQRQQPFERNEDEEFGLDPHDQPFGHLVEKFARILPANSAHWAVFADYAGS